MDKIAIPVRTEPLAGTIRPPGSKSITNRALICAALADGRTHLQGVLDSDDTRVMIAALGDLGLSIDHNVQQAAVDVTGCGGVLPVDAAELFVANSGTTMRFLTALLALAKGRFRIDGVERMRQRPIGDLVDALNSIGAQIECESPNQCPPVVVNARGLSGGEVSIRGDVSSQFLSGLLMAAPLARGDTTIRIDGELVSQPYVEMTLRVMRSFGVAADAEGLQSFHVPGNQAYQACHYTIEPDASAASYFWAAAAIVGGRVTVEGLSRDSLQGDVAFCDCLEQMGCQVAYGQDSVTVVGGPLRGIDVDMNAISDTVQTLAAVALFADGPTRVRGVAHNRYKETDRIGDLATELRKVGAAVEEHKDGLTIVPQPLQAAEINTYHDHRMAMSLALIGLRVPGIVILNPACTEKTYPEYFADLFRLCGNVQPPPTCG